MPPDRRSKAKRYCFTLNNYTDYEQETLYTQLRICSDYFIVGKEVGEEGTSHLQGYFCLTNRDRLLSIKNRLCERMHIEVARGTPSSNRAYCSKEGNFIEEGTIPADRNGGSGKSRDDLASEFRADLERGRLGILEFAENNPGCWGFSGHNLQRNLLGLRPPPTRGDIKVDWIWGRPGVGKSKSAHERYPEAYIKDPRTKWWNGYVLERDCIIDDFAPQGIDINHLLRWFDRYKCYVEVKGDMVPLCVVNFIVTSNFTPQQVFTCNLGVEHVQLPALMRRINVIEML